MRNQIWHLLCDIRFKSYVLCYLVEDNQKKDRAINIFLAITSSSSIAAWALWQDLYLLWAILIALAQVITVIKPFFPFIKNAKELNTKSIELDFMFIEIEKLWIKCQTSKISNDEATEEYFALKSKLVSVVNFGNEIIFRVSKKMIERANKRVENYLKSNYNADFSKTKK